MTLNYNDYGKDRIAEYLTALPEPLESQDVLDVLKVITPDLAHPYSHEWATFIELRNLVAAKTKMARTDVEKAIKQFVEQHAATNGHAPPPLDVSTPVAPEGIDEFLATQCAGTLTRAERDARFQLLIPALALLRQTNPVVCDGHVRQIAATLDFGIRAIKDELSNCVVAQHAATNGHTPPREPLPDSVTPEQIDEFLEVHCTGTLTREERDIRIKLLIPALAVLQVLDPLGLDGHTQQISTTLKVGIRAIKEELSNYVEERQFADDPRHELRITADDLEGMVDTVEHDLLTLGVTQN